MRCPKCTSIEDKVIDSRISREGSTIRRRRECLECGHRFSTTETIFREDLIVVKRDGRKVPFDREKLIRAMRAACHKRPVDLEQINMAVEDITDQLESRFEREIPSHAVGEACMVHLQKIDKVAYVRFASVYKEFRDVSEFMDELAHLAKHKP